jgi:hypothetical protein
MSTVHEPPDASKPVIVADACAYRYQNGGICGCTAADLIHAVVGSAAYESLSTRQRSVLFDEIGGVHPFASTATEPPSSPTPTSAPQPAEVPTAQPFMSAEGGSSAGQARQETRDTITLLPCPFCGAQPTSRAYSTGVPGMEDCDGWMIACRQAGCGLAHIDGDDEAQAAAKWNARVYPRITVHDYTHPAETCDEPGCEHVTRRTCEGAVKVERFLRDTLRERTTLLRKADPAWAARADMRVLRAIFADDVDDDAAGGRS